jgi:hypothetical protein
VALHGGRSSQGRAQRARGANPLPLTRMNPEHPDSSVAGRLLALQRLQAGLGFGVGFVFRPCVTASVMTALAVITHDSVFSGEGLLALRLRLVRRGARHNVGCANPPGRVGLTSP